MKKEKTVDWTWVKIPVWYLAYKSHLSVNVLLNLITSYRVTTMKRNDGKEFFSLVNSDMEKRVTKECKTIYAADKAYDQGDNHVDLEVKGFKNAIALRYGKEHIWNRCTTKEEYQLGKKERYGVERVNASLKNDGLGSARYLGLARMKIQTSMACFTHNLKTLVKLWTGVGLRTFSTAHVSLA